MPSNHLLTPSPLALNLPQFLGLFQRVTSLHQMVKIWSFNFSISPSNEYSGLISFRIDWFDLLAVEGTLKSLLQHHSSKASVLQCSAFFMVQLSHMYMTTGKAISFTIQTFVGKVMYLLFHILSWFVIAFLLGRGRNSQLPFLGNSDPYPSLQRRQWHPSTLAWKIPWMEEPGGLQSMGLLESDTTERLRFHFSLHALEKDMATRSSVLAWRNPGIGEPGGLPSMGSHRVGHD